MHNLKELTLRGMILGAIITIVFTASNVYLGLKVGMTFSSSIPAAVISMAILRFFSNASILENNMVQTQASAAGTLSSVIFVLPGLLMLGYWQNFHFWQTMIICAAGGIMGVVFSIPLRHVMVVKSDLPYPEGVAAAEILRAGSRDPSLSEAEDSAKRSQGLKEIVIGGILASTMSLFTNGFRIISDSTAYWFRAGGSISQIPMGFSLALLSAGYLVGITAGIAILIGIFIAWGVAVPIISSGMEIASDANLADVGMGIWADKVRYLGAGTIGIAAIWTLLTLFKPMMEGIRLSIKAFSRDKSESAEIKRTEQDLSPQTLLLITAGMTITLIGAFYFFISQGSDLGGGTIISLTLISVVISLIIGFLVAAACGYMAGLVGSSSSPISGIGIVAVTVISLVFVGVGQINGMLETDDGVFFATALALFATSTILAMAAISNDNLQDLKTGYLLKATPWRQQVALIVGCVVGAIVIAPILGVLHEAYGFTGAMPREGMDISQALSAPQATLMTTIARGIFSHEMDWSMIAIGVLVGMGIIVIDLILKRVNSPFRIPSLAVGMGIYLPPEINIPIVIGGVISWIVAKQVQKRAAQEGKDGSEMQREAKQRGALLASGLIVGESLVGVLMAVVIVVSMSLGLSEAPLSLVEPFVTLLGAKTFAYLSQLVGLVIFIGICLLFYRRAMRIFK